MGPPLKAAENALAAVLALGGVLASMGPPLKAAENGRRRMGPPASRGGFNGAAAKSSGKSGAAQKFGWTVRRLQWGRR